MNVFVGEVGREEGSRAIVDCVNCFISQDMEDDGITWLAKH